jgi:hypothetical protein
MSLQGRTLRMVRAGKPVSVGVRVSDSVAFTLYRGRVTEEQWRFALARLQNCVRTCSCGASVLRDPDDPGQRCWNCGLAGR